MKNNNDAVLRFGICNGTGASVSNTHVRAVEMPWAEFVAMVSNACVGNKDGPYFTRCPFTGEKRTSSTELAGSLVVLDGDKGVDLETGELTDTAPSPHDVHRALCEADITHVLFTTHSNRPDRPRYRVIVPYPVANKDALRAAVDSLIAVLHAAGVPLTSVKENYTFAQAWYLPRVPSPEALEQFTALSFTGDSEIPMGHGDGADYTAAHWAVELLRGEELHGNALRATGRMVRLGYSDDEITAMFDAMRPGLLRARGATRVGGLLDRGELQRMIAGARRKDFARTQARANAIALGEGMAPVAEEMSPEAMQDRLVFLSDGSRVADRLHPRWAHALGDAKNLYAASRSEGQTPTGRPTTVDNLDVWRRDPARLTAHGLTFHPGVGEFCADPDGRPCLNTWRPYAREPGDPKDAEPLLEHIRFLFADRYDEFLDYLAHIEQRPGELPHRGWLHIASYQGLGRGMLAQALAALWAGHVALAVDLPRILDSDFNGRLSQKTLAVVDELREGSRMEVWQHAEKLKRLITETHRTINPKFGRETVEFNCCRWVIFSNHMDAIPLDGTDRRVDVVISHAPPRDEAYYTALVQAIQDPKVINGFAALLAQRDLSKFNAGGHARLTADKLLAIEQAMPEASQGLSAYLSEPENQSRELFTTEELSRESGITQVGPAARTFKTAIEAVGLRRLKKMRLSNGTRTHVYCRREHFQKWYGWSGRIPAEHCPATRETRAARGARRG